MNNKQILDNAPEGATHYAEGMHYLAYNKSGDWMRYDPNGIGGFCWFNANDFKFSYTRSFHSLSDLRRIVELEAQLAMAKEKNYTLTKTYNNLFDSYQYLEDEMIEIKEQQAQEQGE